ncbi:WD repeat-containing protein 89 [Rhinophrynus dorsalis]
MATLEEQLSHLNIAKCSAMMDSATYVVDIDVSQPTKGQKDETLAILCSNKSIRLYNKETMSLLQEYSCHPGVLSGVKFAHSDKHMVFSACSDGTVKSWDTRVPETEAVLVFNGYPSNAFISFDVSCNDLVVCAGTEQVEDDAFLVFWDARYNSQIKCSSKDPLGVYSESHNDDITQVRFHPTNPSLVASGSTDGLVNVFDISKDNEDDALNATCNSDSSVSFLGWAGQDYNQIYCLTHDEGFCWWDLAQMNTDEPITLSKVQDMREELGTSTIDYLIGGVYHEKVNTLFLAGGTHTGNINLLKCGTGKLKHISTLHGGHSATVRSFYWNLEDQSMLTGGEDAQLLLWKPEVKDMSPKKRESMKMSSSVQKRLRVHNTNSYKTKQK